MYVSAGAINALGEIKSEKTMVELIKILNNRKFFQAENGDYCLNVLNALGKVQKQLGYYQPIS